MCFLQLKHRDNFIFTGSYTDSLGIEIIRRHVAQYIERRDGIGSNWENIILSAGASDAIKVICMRNLVIYTAIAL
jgi:aspartate/methionine/tyrosine aminotransferase